MKKSTETYLNPWDINLTGEEIRKICNTDGIVGIFLHLGNMPGDIARRRLKDLKNKVELDNFLKKILPTNT